MTDSKPYFASPESAVLPEHARDAITALDKTGVVVVKARHPNSKLILQNMEEVLSSVREQHRQKHRRKKELKKLAQMEADAAACSTAAGVVASRGNAALVVVRGDAQKCPRDHHHKRSRKKPLQDKSVQENGIHDAKSAKRKSKSPQQGAPYQNGSILQHFPRTPKKDDDANTSMSINATTRPTNVFEVMMNARNKPVESRTPDKESSISPTAHVELSLSNAKRKLLLQDMADKKGAAKRRLDEETRAVYVELQLEKRAKRFKKMLVNGRSPRGSTTTSQLKSDDLIEIECSASDDDTCTRLVEATAKPKRGRGRRRPFSPLDSDQPMAARTHDPETAEFLAKLSSPTKKRDSLLGYFPKKDTVKPNLEAAAPKESSIKKETLKKRRGRPPGKRALRATDPELLTPETVADAKKTLSPDALGQTPGGGRPRRSCAGRSRHDYDLQESPTKQERQPKIVDLGAEESTITDYEVEVINLDDSSASMSEGTAIQGSCTKLAPLFVRSVPRRSLNPDALKARQLFLMSGVPEKIRLEQKKQRLYEYKYEEELELFPKISHVLQLDSSEQQLLEQPPIALHFKLTPIDSSSLNDTTHSPGNNRRKKAAIRHAKIPTVDKCLSIGDTLAGGQCRTLPAVENKRNVIKEWKMNFERFPTYKCYNQMREKYRHFSAVDTAQDTEQVTESFVVTRRTTRMQPSQKKFDPEAEDEQPPLAAPNGELLFTEKYKPMLFDQVLVNLSPVIQLRDFLATWCRGGGGGGSGTSGRSSQTFDDSMDMMDDSNSSQQAACNSVVLLGPGSSGKTNAVFALANEMNFNVLEINAGMRRTGKILMQELQEATQSHQIRKEPSTTALGKAQRSLLKRSLSGLKARVQSPALDKDDASNSALTSSARKCLILIEDADIVFEQTDAGFADAICTLAACSKRPVIIVATNPKCAHLQRLMSQNTIHFAPPNALNTSKFLSILSLIENCPVQQDDIVSLYLYNRKDLRKTLLELQFFVQSGGDRRRAATQLASSPESPFYVSPSKRRESAGDSAAEQERHEVEQGQQADEQLDKPVAQKPKDAADSDAYMHRKLFELFTVDQNVRWRIPFPVDFRLLHLNVADVFQVAHQLKAKPPASNEASSTTCDKSGSSGSSTKRKSRSPKKAWLSSATVAANTPRVSPMEALCEFYANISVAAAVGVRSDPDLVVRRTNAPPHNADRLVPHLADYIAHDLVERAITVNLEAESCPYNLFDSPTSNTAIGDYLGGTSLSRLGHARFLDYEPVVRAICRSEKLRAALERRSTRFYHYLRGSAMNMATTFSTEHFDSACDILQEQSAKGAEIE